MAATMLIQQISDLYRWPWSVTLTLLTFAFWVITPYLLSITSPTFYRVKLVKLKVSPIPTFHLLWPKSFDNHEDVMAQNRVFTVITLWFMIRIDHVIALMTGLAKPCMSIHPMASPTFCLVSIEVSSLTVTCDCSCLVTDREVLSVSIVIGVVSVGFFFRRFDFPPLQQNLATASSSNFLCLFSNSRRRSDITNKWPLRMTLMCDLDLSVL